MRVSVCISLTHNLACRLLDYSLVRAWIKPLDVAFFLLQAPLPALYNSIAWLDLPTPPSTCSRTGASCSASCDGSAGTPTHVRSICSETLWQHLCQHSTKLSIASCCCLLTPVWSQARSCYRHQHPYPRHQSLLCRPLSHVRRGGSAGTGLVLEAVVQIHNRCLLSGTAVPPPQQARPC